MSPSLTGQLNRWTDLIDILKIQGLNRYFAKFGDEFSWFLKIQGRSWGITQISFEKCNFEKICDFYYVKSWTMNI